MFWEKKSALRENQRLPLDMYECQHQLLGMPQST